MSKKKKVVVSTKKKVAPTQSRATAPAIRKDTNYETLYDKSNYILMAIGLVLVIVGMLLMTGGAQPDPNAWDPSIIYSKRITILGPVVILAGLIVEVYAIFKK